MPDDSVHDDLRHPDFGSDLSRLRHAAPQAELLKAFADLVCKHGSDSQEVVDFRKQHAENHELMTLCDDAQLLADGFRAICDETNNGPEDIETGRLNVTVELPYIEVKLEVEDPELRAAFDELA